MTPPPPRPPSKRVPSKPTRSDVNIVADDPALASSADLLRELAAIEVRLENGSKVAFRMETELLFPTDPDAVREAATKGPAQLAFWAYQAERALHAVRVQELKTKKVESEWYIRYRKYRNEQTDDFPTEAQLRADLDLDDEVLAARTKLHTTKQQYGLIKAMRDSVEHRIYLLRRLTEADNNNHAWNAARSSDR